MGVLEGGDAGEGDDASGGEDALGGFGWAGEAVEDGFDAVGEFGVDFEGVVEALGAGFVAGVDGEIEAEVRGELEVATEEVTLASVVGFVFPAIRGGVEVVEAGFAEGDDFGVVEVGGDEAFEVVARFVDVAGMDAEAAEDFGVGLSEGEVFELIGFVGGKGDDAVDAGFFGTGDDLGDFFGGVSVGAEVTMGVGDHSKI